MHVRHQHILVFGAHHPFGYRVIEALLALGAHVVAAAPLRTELESLRAELRHHERLHVAECGDTDHEGPQRLIEATRRRGPLDAIVHIGGAPEIAAAATLVLAHAIAAAIPGEAPRVVFTRPRLPLDQGDEHLAHAPETRDFLSALLPAPRANFQALALAYDPKDPNPALHDLLMLLSSTLAS